MLTRDTIAHVAMFDTERLASLIDDHGLALPPDNGVSVADHVRNYLAHNAPERYLALVEALDRKDR